jgi:hypothetical protein
MTSLVPQEQVVEHLFPFHHQLSSHHQYSFDHICSSSPDQFCILQRMDESLLPFIDPPILPVLEVAATPASAGTTSSLSTNQDVVVVPSPVGNEAPHPITNATFEHFLGDSFLIDGVEYRLKDVKVDLLRRFCVKNGVKTTAPPHKSLRLGTKKTVVEEIKAKKGRMLNNEPDPWANLAEGNDKSKPAWINRYRLANVVFSEECRSVVANRGKSLTREELDLGLKTDQRIFEKVAVEYNRPGVPAYDLVQFPDFSVVGSKNEPCNFDAIGWEEAKKATKECIHHLEKARKNFEISGCHDSDLEDAAETNGMKIGKFTNFHYVVYWNLFAEVNQELFSVLTGELDASVFKESFSVHASDDIHSLQGGSKRKRKTNDILFDAFHTSAVTDQKRAILEEKRLAIDDERNELLKVQVAAAKKHAAAVQDVCDAEKLHKLTQDQSILRQQQQSYRTALINRYGKFSEVKKRMKAHQRRKATRKEDDCDTSIESNASLMDEMEDVADRLNRIKEDILDHYNKNKDVQED